ncbi:DUF1648 domain-containing protein [Cellulomonas sp. P22]|uniref:DUF1648 domain-containing protein n=1 Tax=Cellulomonas sp. P22 TaxID=3373189 RepID=UPI0037B0A046
MTAPRPTTADATSAARVHAPHRLVSTVLGLGVPALVLVATALVARSWYPDLPDPVASHFGTHGPDEFTSAASFVVQGLAFGAAFAVGGWAIAVRLGRASTVRRMGTGLAAGGATLTSAATLGALWAQRGLDDAAQVVVGSSITLLPIVVGAVVGALAAALTPGDAAMPATTAVPADAPHLALGHQERATWVRQVTSRPLLVAIVAMTAIALVTTSAAPTAAPAVAPFLLALALVVAHVRFTVTVDRRGLRVRSVLGLPRATVPADEVLHAEVVQVAPLRQFGGWGYRVGAGGTAGIVLRKGEALRVERTGGRSFVVTVDDAATGAALLNTLAGRERSATGS